jgi:hypothetical protein
VHENVEIITIAKLIARTGKTYQKTNSLKLPSTCQNNHEG